MRADRDDDLHGVGVVRRLPPGPLVAMAAILTAAIGAMGFAVEFALVLMDRASLHPILAAWLTGLPAGLLAWALGVLSHRYFMGVDGA